MPSSGLKGQPPPAFLPGDLSHRVNHRSVVRLVQTGSTRPTANPTGHLHCLKKFYVKDKTTGDYLMSILKQRLDITLAAKTSHLVSEVLGD